MTKRQCSRWAACVAAVSLLLAACSGGGGGDNQSQSTQGTGADQVRGVDVTVLPPISVADWTRENIDERIEEVRGLFRATLQNWPG